uniref:Putative activating signal cointegrator 1 complex subunit n=1 Tax=Ornithodoros turicata TaxID=34597 RepID=A0A2R5L904_9ACAR
MDVLNCELLWIEGRCYRKICSVSESTKKKTYRYNSYEDEPVCMIPNSVSQVAGDSGTRSTGYFCEHVPVPQQFLARICGAKHVRRNQIERETNTKIDVPGKDTDGDVVVSGPDKNGVDSACLRLRTIVSQLRQKEEFTHFVALPLNLPVLDYALREFEEIVLKTCSMRDIDRSLFQTPGKLHMTIGMLVLLGKKEVKQAENILHSCSDLVTKVLEDEPLRVRVQGLEYMNDDPSQVDVLYAKAVSYSTKDGHPNNRLQQFADEVAQRFLDAGLMLQPQSKQVKLHITLMNTKFREQRFATENVSRTAPRNPRQSFDASAILKRYRDHNFGKVTIPYVSILLPRTCDTKGFYVNVGQLSLPSGNQQWQPHS